MDCKIFTENITGNVVSTEPNLIIKNTKIILIKIFGTCFGEKPCKTKIWDINNYIRLAQELSKKRDVSFILPLDQMILISLISLKNQLLKILFHLKSLV